MIKRRRQEQEQPAAPKSRSKRSRAEGLSRQTSFTDGTESIATRDDDRPGHGSLPDVFLRGRGAAPSTSFAPLQNNARRLLRKLLHNAYIDTENKHPNLSTIAKNIDQRLGRTLFPTTVRERMFDRELLVRESAEKRRELRLELEEYAKFKTNVLMEKRALEDDEAELNDIQESLAQKTATANNHPLLMIRAVPGDYVQNLFRYPSAKFARRE